MTLNELTNADAIEAAWEEAWNEAQKRIIALVKKGLTSEQLKQAIQSERSYVVPQTTKTRSFKE